MKPLARQAAWAAIGLIVLVGVVGCGDNSTKQDGPATPSSSVDTRAASSGGGSKPVDPRVGSGDTRGASPSQ